MIYNMSISDLILTIGKQLTILIVICFMLFTVGYNANYNKDIFNTFFKSNQPISLNNNSNTGK